ncbi:MAG: HEAT repeat domain-containing protein [Myxococcales bacterium]|nr:HEAT repeat domain-containing protein [Myxococcales bacterium]
MTPPRRTGLMLALVTVLVASSGCEEKKPVVHSPSQPPTQQPRTPKTAEVERFCVMALQLEQNTPKSRRLPGLPLDVTLAAVALRRVHELDVPRGPGRCERTPPLGKIGLAIGVEYGATGATGANKGWIRPDSAAKGAQLYVSVTAHAERAGPTGKPDIARSTVEAFSPLVKSDLDGARRRVKMRMIAAMTIATQRATGQLWIRHRPDTDVVAALKDKHRWRRAAAILEVGERGLMAQVEAVEHAASASLSNIAVVACATLGRLGQARSIPILARRLDGAPTEVTDAALLALSDIGGPKAKSLIRRTSESHRSPWIRLRAKALLDATGNPR